MTVICICVDLSIVRQANVLQPEGRAQMFGFWLPDFGKDIPSSSYVLPSAAIIVSTQTLWMLLQLTTFDRDNSGPDGVYDFILVRVPVPQHLLLWSPSQVA